MNDLSFPWQLLESNLNHVILSHISWILIQNPYLAIYFRHKRPFQPCNLRKLENLFSFFLLHYCRIWCIGTLIGQGHYILFGNFFQMQHLRKFTHAWCPAKIMHLRNVCQCKIRIKLVDIYPSKLCLTTYMKGQLSVQSMSISYLILWTKLH